MKTPTVNMKVEIERLSDTVLALMPDFNGEIETKIKEATKQAIESYNFDIKVREVVHNALSMGIEKAIVNYVNNFDFFKYIDIDGIIKKSIG